MRLIVKRMTIKLVAKGFILLALAALTLTAAAQSSRRDQNTINDTIDASRRQEAPANSNSGNPQPAMNPDIMRHQRQEQGDDVRTKQRQQQQQRAIEQELIRR